MVDVEIVARKPHATVLAGIAVARVDIEATETNLPLGDTIECEQENDPGHPNRPVHEADGVVVHGHGKRTPTVKIERLILVVHGTCDSLIEEGEGTPNGGYVNGKIRAIEDQNLGVQDQRAGRSAPSQNFLP